MMGTVPDHMKLIDVAGSSSLQLEGTASGHGQGWQAAGNQTVNLQVPACGGSGRDPAGKRRASKCLYNEETPGTNVSAMAGSSGLDGYPWRPRRRKSHGSAAD